MDLQLARLNAEAAAQPAIDLLRVVSLCVGLADEPCSGFWQVRTGCHT